MFKFNFRKSAQEPKGYSREEFKKALKKDKIPEWGKRIAEGLNMNVLLDHIDEVNLGVRKPDETYYKALNMQKEGKLPYRNKGENKPN